MKRQTWAEMFQRMLNSESFCPERSSRGRSTDDVNAPNEGEAAVQIAAANNAAAGATAR
jgi:hypothetical protein